MTDRIQLTGIEVLGRHGVFTEEKFTDQPFVVDLDCVLERPAIADDLDTTVDYGELAQRVADVIQERSVDLIETLAERIAAACLAYPVITGVTVTVHKPEAPMQVPVRDVAVSVTRRRP
ncbi:MAG: dihydroneopterin aldolase [Propionicimonas sp.]|uniref:dihydroneopterin aldolase n=1 Tax=Propionicimonas sp. TaxID=1955623 RepID=UPI002B2028CF|nr:dihydroneopterin aldolase [Propionicimonas sp.]MEA4944901.1 dihydroneopterin aldolase [Propionicimonas sp.]MEA5055417.1 dihydroneopterin aldolase [Propionicimonas sp.]MEA5119585.1 dihydroneopterin aldolase [Propionicimonas sp.]